METRKYASKIKKKLGTIFLKMSLEEEKVLVVPRDIIAPKPWHGIKNEGVVGFEALVKKHGLFKRRSEVEEDSNWKQIVPYLIFRYKDYYWVMQRTDQAGENRLHDLYTLGIGGHIRKKDWESKTVMDWAKREFEEEVDYHGLFISKPIGLLNAEDTPVSQVHLGYVILIDGNSKEIKLKEEDHQNGQLLTLPQMKKLYDQMEGWSKLVYDFLVEQYG